MRKLRSIERKDEGERLPQSMLHWPPSGRGRRRRRGKRRIKIKVGGQVQKKAQSPRE
jgi:hypothetical protein